jgi:hypothetical protein
MRLYQGRCRDLLPRQDSAVPRLRGMPEALRSTYRPRRLFFLGDAPNTERTGLLALRPDLNAPLLTSKTDAQREAELTRVNGKLYTIAKAQSDKSCPAVATGLTGSVVR